MTASTMQELISAPTKPYLSVQEAADLLNVNAKVVRRLIHSGEMPHIRLGSKIYRIPFAALSLLTAGGRK